MMDAKQTKKSTIVGWPNRNRLNVFIFMIILILTCVALVLFIFLAYKNKSSNDNKKSTEQNTIYNQDPLAANRYTGTELDDSVAKSKKDAEVILSEINTLTAPTNDTERLALANKYIKLANLYIESYDFIAATDTLSKLYDSQKFTVDFMYRFKDIDMEAQGAFGTIYYSTGNYKNSLDAYQRALDIASNKNSRGADKPYSPEAVNKYTEAISHVKSKMGS